MTPPWLHSGGVPTIPTEPRWEDGVVALALGLRRLVDPNSEINGTLYGIKGIAPDYLKGRRPWEDMAETSGAGGEDVAGTSGGGDTDEARTWGSIEEDGWFPSLIDQFLHHGGSLETLHELIWGVKERTREELEH